MRSYFDHIRTTQEFKEKLLQLKKKSVKIKSPSGKEEYWTAVKNFCLHFKLLPTSFWLLMIDELARFDNWEVFDYFRTPGMCSMITFEEIEYENRFQKGKDPFSFKKAFPVLLGISPYASRQDIIDFIEKTYAKRISPTLDKYKNEKIPISKIKKKSKSERDDFIFEHRYLPYAEVDELQKAKFGGRLLGWDYIGKIVRKEMKRRGVEE